MKHSEIELNKIAQKITGIKQGLLEFEIEDAHKVHQQLTSILIDKIKETYNVSDAPVFPGDRIIAVTGEHAGRIFTVKHRAKDDIGCLSHVFNSDLRIDEGITVYKEEVGGQETLTFRHGRITEFFKLEEEGSIKERFKTEKRIAYTGERIVVPTKKGNENILMVKAHHVGGGVYLQFIDESCEEISEGWLSFSDISSYEVIIEQESLTNDQKRYKAIVLSSRFLIENEFKNEREKGKRVKFKVDPINLCVTGYLMEHDKNEVLKEYTLNRKSGEVFNKHIFKAKVYSELLGIELPSEILKAPQPKELRRGMVVTGNREDTQDFYNKNRRFTLYRKKGNKWEYKEDSKDWLLESNIGEILLDEYEINEYKNWYCHGTRIRL